jgi:hypothetical protein
MSNVNEESTMPPPEKILILNNGIPSNHHAVIDPSKTCDTITTGFLKRFGFSSLDMQATGDGKHSELHQGDGYTSTVQLEVASYLVMDYEMRPFCVIESDSEAIVLHQPLDPNYTQAPPLGMLPIVRNPSTLTDGSFCHQWSKMVRANDCFQPKRHKSRPINSQMSRQRHTGCRKERRMKSNDDRLLTRRRRRGRRPDYVPTYHLWENKATQKRRKVEMLRQDGWQSTGIELYCNQGG